MEEFDDGRAILEMRFGRALEFGAVLAGTRQLRRIGGLDDRAAGMLDGKAERQRCEIGIEQDRSAPGQHFASRPEFPRLPPIGKLRPIGAYLDAGLAFVHDSVPPARGCHSPAPPPPRRCPHPPTPPLARPTPPHRRPPPPPPPPPPP